MPEWLTLSLIAVFSGLIWFLYKHPKEGRNLVWILFGLMGIIFIAWSMFEFGANDEYRRIKKELNLLYIKERDDFDPMIFMLSSVGVFIVLIALSHFFQSIKEKSGDKVNN